MKLLIPPSKLMLLKLMATIMHSHKLNVQTPSINLGQKKIKSLENKCFLILFTFPTLKWFKLHTPKQFLNAKMNPIKSYT